MRRISQADLIKDFQKMGISEGDTLLVRARLGAVGRLSGGAAIFVDALLETVGAHGTVVSLAFTGSTFVRKPRKEERFHPKKESNAGALPNEMIRRSDAYRSRHPMCSYVAIGKHAKEITDGHDHHSPAYEPIRKIVELQGKNLLVGCVASSPGFTTTHLAEQDLGLLKLNIFSRFHSVYFMDEEGNQSLFRRKDAGLCSNSFYKFYAHYVSRGLLTTGTIGDAYSIIAPARPCYETDLEILAANSKFNICESKDCFICNASRWDRIHHLPGFALRSIWRRARFQGRQQ